MSHFDAGAVHLVTTATLATLSAATSRPVSVERLRPNILVDLPGDGFPEDGELRVPYSVQRLDEAPEVDDSDGISAECDRQLRDYYGIDAGDRELRSDNKSYATLVPDEAGASRRVENADELDTPDADTRTDESHERLRDPGSAKMRQVSAEQVAHNTQGGSDAGDGDQEDRGDSDG